MSTKCVFRVDKAKVVKSHFLDSNTSAEEKKRPCGKDPQVFLRFEYSQLYHYREREGKFSDSYGFCAEHAQFVLDNQDLLGSMGSLNADAYRHRIINGLRGAVKFVSVIDPSEVGDPVQRAIAETKLRRMVSVKGDIKRIMNQKNMGSLTVDDWREVFEEALNDFIVEGVMGS